MVGIILQQRPELIYGFKGCLLTQGAVGGLDRVRIVCFGVEIFPTVVHCNGGDVSPNCFREIRGRYTCLKER